MLDEALTLVQVAGGAITLLAIGAMVWRRAETHPGDDVEAVLPVAAGAD
jgi:hypothetical protein